MKIGLGIDTGGTYTDAVLYDFETKQVLSSAKSLTTKEDLALGIGNSLDKLDAALLAKIKMVSLSTTLATNACVEDKGGRGKLVFIGGYKKVVDETGQSYGLPPSDEIFFLEGGVNLNGQVEKQPDWDDFVTSLKPWIADADAVAVVEHLGICNPAFENKAKALIQQHYGKSVICGHELFADYNYVKRGAGTLLNARLVPVIAEFLQAIRLALQERGIKAPVVIVRSDGSLMSEHFTAIRPVETLLCGPAASVMGGLALTNEQNALVVDMGGTTTDIAIVQNGTPLRTENGVNVGKWRTFVKAVYIDTFGLGGDSAVWMDNKGRMTLGPVRAVPLCTAAARWPEIVTKLETLIGSDKVSTFPLHEFISRVRQLPKTGHYTPEEHLLCEALNNGPLTLAEAAEVMGKDLYTMKTDRLEREGILIRCGLTPTDIMHIQGDFDHFDRHASELGARFVAACMGLSVKALCEQVYDRVKETLYCNIARLLLQQKYPSLRENGLGEEMTNLIRENWKEAKSGKAQGFLNLNISTPASLVGIGAPIHIFLPDVAKALGTKAVIPPFAGVANALGAIVGHITVTKEIEVRPEYSASGVKGYFIFGENVTQYAIEQEDAIQIACKEAENAAKTEALRRGATGEIVVTSETNIRQTDVNVQDGEVAAVCLGIWVKGTAAAKIMSL